ncbi:DUF5063 domain-containing protein [Aquimarina sp. BL5]|uniref:DUF5063 domain-containing protein n=1 Tax=Aquimarina sp. BL5 TaxID=1714860 RepID=UPI000E490CDB|nr:DUF5063 domain-containing protein [Aquimarina sp. BL5]AXT53637.1 DUF5063 domain-containing protein [Aquimarina sp. BL5]RKN05041.1 DUF5063 domain-containing protein [Aquimarina sp. BL5]
MNTLLGIIEPIIQWGATPKLPIKNKELVLKKSLISLYQEYLALEGNVPIDEEEYPEAPEFNFEKISNTIRSNFPKLGFYQTVLDPFDMIKPDNGLGDANDDLSDIIKDLMEVQWRFQNTSEVDAIWYFEFIMRNHSERHLVNILKTLKDLEEQL